jgi:hypothetical protein
MILLWGIAGDGPLVAVREALDRLGAAYAFLDQCRLDDVALELTIGKRVEGWIRLRPGEHPLELDRIGSFYLRPYDSQRLIELTAGDTGQALAIDRALMTWAESMLGLVVNRPSAMWSNNSKPYQAQLIRRLGFRVPDTLVTTDPRAARAFRRLHGRVVYKSLSGIRSIVTQLSLDHLARLDDLASCPTQFQAYVPGEDYRIHVVGKQVFATLVRSSADDYRYPSRGDTGATTTLEAASISATLRRACLRLSAGLGLAVSGIDLRHSPAGDWYYFEVNPSPGFSHYEEATGQPIAEAVARLLIGGTADLTEPQRRRRDGARDPSSSRPRPGGRPAPAAAPLGVREDA